MLWKSHRFWRRTRSRGPRGPLDGGRRPGGGAAECDTPPFARRRCIGGFTMAKSELIHSLQYEDFKVKRRHALDRGAAQPPDRRGIADGTNSVAACVAYRR